MLEPQSCTAFRVVAEEKTMAYRTAMFFLVLASLVGALGVIAFAGPANIAKGLFLIFMTLFLALAALRIVLPAGPSESRR